MKLTENRVEIFLNGERLALHPRDRSRSGKRVRIMAHFPDASVAYYEATPQHLLSQARFLHADLHQLVVELFNFEVYGNIRRVQGLIRSATKAMHGVGRDEGAARVAAAIAEMRRAGRYRVGYFSDLLTRERQQITTAEASREIVRRPGNPLLRYAAAADHPVPHPAQESPA